MRKKVLFKIAACCIPLFVLFGCGNKSKNNTLLLHAGAGIATALSEIEEAFEKDKGVMLDISYKGSGYALADISMSKEGDLFMPGEEFYLNQAKKRGFIASSDVVAYFIPVIMTSRRNEEKVYNVHDFSKPGLRVGLGDPKACACGIWHEKVFKKAGIWDNVNRNITMKAFCIPELGNAMKLNHIDATIVWSAVALAYKEEIDVHPVDKEYRNVIPIPLGILSFSRNKESARMFVDYCKSDTCRQIFQKHAFTVDPSNVDSDFEMLKKKISDSHR